MEDTKVDISPSNEQIKEFGIRIPVLSTLGAQISEAKGKIIHCKGYFPLAKSQPHITIASLLANWTNSRKIKEALHYLENIDRFTLGVKEITYSTQADKNGFHTAFLPLDSTVEFTRIQNTVKAGVSRFISSKYSNYPRPHITITKYLPGQTGEVQSILNSFVFEKDFLVTETELLHRNPGEGWDWLNRKVIKLK